MKEEERRGWISLAAGVAEKREGEIWVPLSSWRGQWWEGKDSKTQDGLAWTRCEIALEHGVVVLGTRQERLVAPSSSTAFIPPARKWGQFSQASEGWVGGQAWGQVRTQEPEVL